MHTTSDLAVSLSAGLISDVNESVVSGGENVANSKFVIVLLDGRWTIVLFLLLFLFSSFTLWVRASPLTILYLELC